MAIIQYNLSKFDKEKASGGSLCVCVKSIVTPPTSVKSNEDDKFVGAGMCEYKDCKFHLTINSRLFAFNDKGEAANNNAYAENCKLLIGDIEKTVIAKGNVVVTHIDSTDQESKPTRASDGSYTPATEQYSPQGQNVYVDTLNARDHFASQALQMLLARMEKNPATISDNEMSYLSDVAYRYAANMMVAAANARAILKDDTAGDTTTEAEVGELDSNTEKLLNNLVIALQRTDHVEIDGENNIYSERIINPKLNKWLNDYVDNGETGEAHRNLGLKDLIDAISQGGGGGGTGGTVQIGDEGLGRSRAYPFYISNSDESKYVPYAIYQYRSKGEAESDGWEFDSTDNVWKKAYYNDVPGTYTDESAKSLPTWKNVVKVSIVEMADLIAAVNNVADAIRNQ